MTCRTCELLARRDRGEAPPWDAIVRTGFWDVVHCDRGAVVGWTILVIRRHVSAVADLTAAEAAAIGPLVHRVSGALTQVLGCESTYVVNFAEHPLHRHVHIHVIPRGPDLGPEFRGPGIFQLLNVDESRNVPEQQKNEFATQLRELLDDAAVGAKSELMAAEACRLEVALLDADVRRDPEQVGLLLHPDFAEFGSSGRVWSRADTIEALAGEQLAGEPSGTSPVKIADMQAAEIASGAFLVTYRSTRAGRTVLRSSMWVAHEGRLRIRWHQGTQGR